MARLRVSAIGFGFILVLASVGSLSARADELDAASATALEETRALLGNPEARKAATAEDPKAKAADQGLKSLGLNGADQESVYGISSEILEKWVRETGGDPTKLNTRIQDLMRNPAAFEKELTPEQLAKIRRLSEGVTPKRTP
jgi:hypothetical protein